ncbi:MAG: sensor histidine kinase [Sorangiineae bacterium PRO1]|nr:sensor histidine kinase [Sorangiineae bacterium PRO1]
MSLNDIVVEAVQRIQPLASVNRVQIRVTLTDPSDDGASINVRGDMNLLVLMIGNLVHNAVRFSPQGESVNVCVAVRGSHAEVEVEDRGPGIDHEMTGKLFERFATRRVDSSTGRRQGGSGLGLAIARGVARLHGGDLVASEHFRPGAKFIARLPIAAA